ncbi:hypothetical protein M2282_001510 [Variovorax boronicumulans]|uniref:DUF4241 domain-containing protein n=1 Tax=Variovorax boronicumulans TaxID=436515 RepID=UPI002472F054|nr:DUF4241 domain-containing protein [Variovorax boronicumulans]MDH6166369.1 hypothetical protein [Variovorax boronicumulans]
MAYLDIDNLHTIFLGEEALRALHLERLPCGALNIRSGRIVACDPLVQPERQPFARELQARGAFPVEVLHDKGRHALAVLWLRDRDSVRAAELSWQMALIEGESPDTLGDDEFYGYPIDAGLGCFMEPEAATAMAERDKREATDPDFISYYDDVIAGEMGDADVIDHYPLGPGSASNMVIFRSGWGDGSYPSFWALDAAGEPVALVTDFMTMEGGDARDEDDKRSDAYKASLSPEKHEALEALGAAAVEGDAAAIKTLLEAGLAQPNEIIPSFGETAITSAIRMNRLDALRALLAAVQGLPMPPQFYSMDKEESYIDYARGLKKPRVNGLIDLLENAAAPAAKPGFLKRLFS